MHSLLVKVNSRGFYIKYECNKGSAEALVRSKIEYFCFSSVRPKQWPNWQTKYVNPNLYWTEDLWTVISLIEFTCVTTLPIKLFVHVLHTMYYTTKTHSTTCLNYIFTWIYALSIILLITKAVWRNFKINGTDESKAMCSINININICSIELKWDGKITKIW